MENIFQVFENHLDGIVVINRDGVIQFVNLTAEKLFGRSSTELSGHTLGFPLVAGEFSDVEIIGSGGLPITVEMRVTETRWQNEPGFLVSLRDITERKRFIRDLEQARRFNESVLNALTSHIAVLTKEGVIVQVNRAWEGFARENGDPSLTQTGVGINYFDVCRAAAETGDDLAARAAAGMSAVLRGQVPIFELEYPCHSLTAQRWYMMRVTLFSSSDTPYLVVSHTDITQRLAVTREQVESELEAATVEHQQQELISLEALADEAHGNGNHSLAILLRDRMPDRFAELVSRCEALLDKAVQQRTFAVHHPMSEELRAVAEYLGSLKAGPRDVMEIYLKALKNRIQNQTPQKSNVYVEEGRILVLELMGYLVGFYRSYLPPVLRNPNL